MILRAASFGLLALLTAPLLAAEDAKPDVPAKSDAKADAEAARWEALQKQLKEIRDDLADLRRRRDIDEKARAIEVDIFRERLDRLERSLEGLKATTRIASSFTPGAPSAVGTIRLENRTSIPSTVLLAGRSHRVGPQETLVLQNQPAGAFSYEVLAEGFGMIRPATARVLASGETFAILINP